MDESEVPIRHEKQSMSRLLYVASMVQVTLGMFDNDSDI